jgi:hypothetical protein
MGICSSTWLARGLALVWVRPHPMLGMLGAAKLVPNRALPMSSRRPDQGAAEIPLEISRLRAELEQLEAEIAPKIARLQQQINELEAKHDRNV